MTPVSSPRRVIGSRLKGDGNSVLWADGLPGERSQWMLLPSAGMTLHDIRYTALAPLCEAYPLLLSRHIIGTASIRVKSSRSVSLENFATALRIQTSLPLFQPVEFVRDRRRTMVSCAHRSSHHHICQSARHFRYKAPHFMTPAGRATSRRANKGRDWTQAEIGGRKSLFAISKFVSREGTHLRCRGSGTRSLHF